MKPGRPLFHLALLMFAALAAAGCNSLPGLRVLSGQTDEQTASADLTVQALDLVMADKSGTTAPALSAAADRIEAANPTLDIIRIDKNDDTGIFSVDALYLPPQMDTSTQEGQRQFVENLRRAFEITWQGMMRVSEGSTSINVRLIRPGQLETLDHGVSIYGVIFAGGSIERSIAANYLAGQRNLNTFQDLVVTGEFDYQDPQSGELYTDRPNHPVYILSELQQQVQ